MTGRRTRPGKSWSCDRCELQDVPCPGLERHCQDGQHCTGQSAGCDGYEALGLHASACCVCGADQ